MILLGAAMVYLLIGVVLALFTDSTLRKTPLKLLWYGVLTPVIVLREFATVAMMSPEEWSEWEHRIRHCKKCNRDYAAALCPKCGE